MDDWELLTAYTRERSEEAFAAIVARYVDLVYSAALRQIGDPELARDVTQAVFVTLARKAAGLGRETILSGWLYRTARFVALEAVRAESRRKRREETTVGMNINPDPTPEEIWKEAAPHIDSAMEQLSESDRAAVLLRYFHGRSPRELAAVLGVSDEAAKKRVSRALERLRQILRREGVTSSGSLLSAALTAYAVQSAPTALGSAISTAALQGTMASVELLSKGALEMIAWTKIKMTAACAATALLMTGTASVCVHHARVARQHDETLMANARSRQEPPVREERFRAAFEATDNENRALQGQAQELYRLRNAVAQLQTAQKQKPPPSLESAGRIQLQSAPPPYRAAAETLRELQFREFMAAGRKAMTLQPMTDKEFPTPEYISEINYFKNLGLALRIYASNHGDEFPATLEQLMQTDLLTDSMKQKLEEGRYEYHVFKDAEKKPELPAVWWAVPDEKGVRVVVLNGGSVHRIREPAGVQTPGLLAIGGAK
jgi:RNA polymerase sigma factor (sigma-70 family)